MKIKLSILSALLLSLAFLPGVSQDNKEEGIVLDQVIAVVGGNIILQSDLDAQYIQYKMQEGATGEESEIKCAMLESMLFQKLMLTQADLDSVTVSEGQVEAEMDRRLRHYISLFGSQEKFEEFYQKSTLEFKDELREQVRDMMLVEKVQMSITENLNVTPTEVKNYFKEMPEDSIPFINSEVEMSQIVKMPPINEEEIQRVKNKLQELRYRVMNGESFATLAILYSEDPGSAKKGGELGLYGRGEMYPEFEAASFALKGDEVSDIVKTDAGYHIIQLIERRGEYINVRHILIRPKVSPMDLVKAKLELDSIADLIEKGTYSFEEAVQKFSDDPSKNNGGLVLNPMTGTSLFESDQLDPKVFFVIDKLSEGDISAPVQFQTQEGKDAYRILYLRRRTEPHKANLKDDYDQIQEWALEYKKQETITKWVRDKSKNTYVKVNDDFESCDFVNKWEN